MALGIQEKVQPGMEKNPRFLHISLREIFTNCETAIYLLTRNQLKLWQVCASQEELEQK